MSLSKIESFLTSIEGKLPNSTRGIWDQDIFPLAFIVKISLLSEKVLKIDEEKRKAQTQLIGHFLKRIRKIIWVIKKKSMKL